MELRTAVFIRSYALDSQLSPSDGREIALCGRSNVGKSTLINKLCANGKLARVSSTPGKTTTINKFSLKGGWQLFDLPGYGYAKRPRDELERWAKLMEHYFTSGRNIELTLLLVDSRRGLNDDDRTMLSCIADSGAPVIVVLTKVDKLSARELEEAMEKAKLDTAFAEPYAVVGFSERDDSASRLAAVMTRCAGD